MSNSVVSVSDVSVRFGAQTVLDRATLNLAENERVGLVGRNGVGKSTFLRVAAGDLLADTGTVARRRSLEVGFVPQTSNLDPETTVRANVLTGAARILDWIAEYERIPSDRPESSWSGEAR